MVYLSESNKHQLFVPRGFAHGFITMRNDTIFQYKCDNFYNKESECAIRWDDPYVNISWPLVDSTIILSEKDQKHKMLLELSKEDLFEYKS